jgi:hypothetical protein
LLAGYNIYVILRRTMTTAFQKNKRVRVLSDMEVQTLASVGSQNLAPTVTAITRPQIGNEPAAKGESQV